VRDSNSFCFASGTVMLPKKKLRTKNLKEDGKYIYMYSMRTS
jgi:hypothetical protein